MTLILKLPYFVLLKDSLLKILQYYCIYAKQVMANRLLETDYL